MRSVTVHNLKAALDEGSALIIDVREPYEYADGHVPGAELMPLMTVPQRVGLTPTDWPACVMSRAVGGLSGPAAAFSRNSAAWTPSTSTVAPASGSPGYRAMTARERASR